MQEEVFGSMIIQLEQVIRMLKVEEEMLLLEELLQEIEIEVVDLLSIEFH